MWCISLAPDAWNLSRHCQATQDAQDVGDVTQDTLDAGDATQDAQAAGDTTHDAQDTGGAKDATQDSQDAQDADSASRGSGRNGAISEVGYFFAAVMGTANGAEATFEAAVRAEDLVCNHMISGHAIQ